MPRNIEVKARIPCVSALMPRAREVAAGAPVLIEQDDTFFPCRLGRLKLRTFSSTSGELIFYTRADDAGPKTSDYRRVPTDAPDALREALTLSLGVIGRVRKRRWLYLAGRTRIHLDEVEGLGSFLELEVVLHPDESEQAGVEEAHRLMQVLGVRHQDLLRGAYLDLLQAHAPCPPSPIPEKIHDNTPQA